MDLSTMGAKLEAGMYPDRFAFEADFALMVDNARQYNVGGSYAHNVADTLQSVFDKREPLYFHGISRCIQ
jgi:transcription initiation factor TFIID subunit 2